MKIDDRMVQHMLTNLGQKSIVLSTPVTQMHPSTINQNCQTEIWTGTGWAECRSKSISCPKCEYGMVSDAERQSRHMRTQSAAKSQATQGQVSPRPEMAGTEHPRAQFTGEQTCLMQK